MAMVPKPKLRRAKSRSRISGFSMVSSIQTNSDRLTDQSAKFKLVTSVSAGLAALYAHARRMAAAQASPRYTR